MIVKRMCAVCREKKPREKLVRVTKTVDGFSLDLENKIQGRGAYICKEDKCIISARKKNAFERSFSAKINAEIYDALEGLVNNGE